MQNRVNRITVILAVLVLSAAALLFTPPTATAATRNPFLIFRAAAADLDDGKFVLDHPLLNGKSAVGLVITQLWGDAGGAPGVYNDNPIAVEYSPISNRWQIFNRNDAPIPVGAQFVVAVTDLIGSQQLRQLPTLSADESLNYFHFDHTDLNNTPDTTAVLTPFRADFLTARANPTGAYGIFYDTEAGRWSGFWEDTTQTVLPAWGYHLMILDPTVDLIHTASASNTANQTTYLDHPSLNGKPDAALLITHNYNHDLVNPIYLPHNTGVRYDTSLSRWAIFNQDNEPMPLGVSFNVMIGTRQAAAAPTTAAPTIVTPPTVRPIIITSTPRPAPVTCLPSRLAVGGQGQITPGSPNRLRNAASTSAPIIREIPGGQVVNILSLYGCVNGVQWVQVQFAGSTGFTAESQGSVYFITPFSGTPPTIATTASVVPTAVPGATFGVVGATSTVAPVINAPCPTPIIFGGQVVVNRGGAVTYRYERSDGTSGPVLTWNATDTATTFNWSYTWTVNASGSYGVRIHVLTPSDVTSNMAMTTLSCAAPAATVSISGAVVAPPINTICGLETHTFTTVVSASGPVTITYRWLRSDGASAPVETLVFSAADAKPVTTTWYLGGIGTFWQQLEILTPISLLGPQLPVVRSC